MWACFGCQKDRSEAGFDPHFNMFHLVFTSWVSLCRPFVSFTCMYLKRLSQTLSCNTSRSFSVFLLTFNIFLPRPWEDPVFYGLTVLTVLMLLSAERSLLLLTLMFCFLHEVWLIYVTSCLHVSQGICPLLVSNVSSLPTPAYFPWQQLLCQCEQTLSWPSPSGVLQSASVLYCSNYLLVQYITVQ